MTENDGVDETVVESTKRELNIILVEYHVKTKTLSHLIRALSSIELQSKKESNKANGFGWVDVYPTDSTLDEDMTKTRRKEIYDHILKEVEKVLGPKHLSVITKINDNKS